MDLMAQAMRRSCAAKVAGCWEEPATVAVMRDDDSNDNNKSDNNNNSNNPFAFQLMMS